MVLNTNYKSRYGFKFNLKKAYFITKQKKGIGNIEFNIDAIQFETKSDPQYLKTVFNIPLSKIDNGVIDHSIKQQFDEHGEIIDVDKPNSERNICYGCAKLTKSVCEIEYARLNYSTYMTEKQLQSIYKEILMELDRFRTVEVRG